MSLWESVAGLELKVDDYGLRRRESATPSGWTRVTTTVELEGDGVSGEGEDVTHPADYHADEGSERLRPVAAVVSGAAD